MSPQELLPELEAALLALDVELVEPPPVPVPPPLEDDALLALDAELAAPPPAPPLEDAAPLALDAELAEPPPAPVPPAAPPDPELVEDPPVWEVSAMTTEAQAPVIAKAAAAANTIQPAPSCPRDVIVVLTAGEHDTTLPRTQQALPLPLQE